MLRKISWEYDGNGIVHHRNHNTHFHFLVNFYLNDNLRPILQHSKILINSPDTESNVEYF